MSAKQELEAAIKPDQYVIVELDDYPCDPQREGRFIGIGQDGFLKLRDHGLIMSEIWIDIDDINCVMDDQCVVLWPREAE